MPETQPDPTLYTYVWDLEAGEDDRLAADCRRWGIDSLSLAATYHAGKFLRPHGRGRRVFFPQPGTAHCRIRPERYGRLKPQESDAVADGDPFGRWCRRADVGTNAWMVLLHDDRLGALHPDTVARNLFDDPYPYSLCPSHPEVGNYAVALCADIADAYPVKSLILETPGWMAFRHGFHHEFSLVGANPWLDAMLGLCFCPHCRDGAARDGIAVDDLQRRLRTRVEASLAASGDTPAAVAQRWLDYDLVADPELAAFARWRCGVVTGLVARIREAVRPDCALRLIPSIQRPAALAWLEGSDLAALAAVTQGLDVAVYDSDATLAAGDVFEITRRLNEAGQDTDALRWLVRPGPPDHPDEGAFRRTVSTLRGAGAKTFGFYNFGHVRRGNLEWIRAL